MGNIASFNDIIIREYDQLTRALEVLENKRYIYGIFAALADLWQGDGTRGANVDVHQVLSLDLYLAKDDSIKDFLIFVDEHITPLEDDLLKYSGDSSVPDSGWIGLWYMTEWGNALVRCFFRASKHCTLVGTGVMREEMKVVCPD